MAKEKTKARTLIGYNCGPSEGRKVRAMAEAAGMTLTAYVRLAVRALPQALAQADLLGRCLKLLDGLAGAKAHGLALAAHDAYATGNGAKSERLFALLAETAAKRTLPHGESQHGLEQRELAAIGALSALAQCWPIGHPHREQIERNIQARDWERMALDGQMTMAALAKADQSGAEIVSLDERRNYEAVRTAWEQPSAMQAAREQADDGDQGDLLP